MSLKIKNGSLVLAKVAESGSKNIGNPAWSYSVYRADNTKKSGFLFLEKVTGKLFPNKIYKRYSEKLESAYENDGYIIYEGRPSTEKGIEIYK